MKFFFAFCFCILITSCTGDAIPKEIIAPKQMQEVFWDFIQVDVYTTDYILPDSTKSAIAENIILQKAVFTKHKVTKDQFYKSYDYYLNHPAIMSNILDSMMADQGKRQMILNDSAVKRRERMQKKDSLAIK